MCPSLSFCNSSRGIGDHRGVITRFYLNCIKCLRPNRSAFGFLNRNLIMPMRCVNYMQYYCG